MLTWIKIVCSVQLWEEPAQCSCSEQEGLQRMQEDEGGQSLPKWQWQNQVEKGPQLLHLHYYRPLSRWHENWCYCILTLISWYDIWLGVNICVSFLSISGYVVGTHTNWEKGCVWQCCFPICVPMYCMF